MIKIVKPLRFVQSMILLSILLVSFLAFLCQSVIFSSNLEYGTGHIQERKFFFKKWFDIFSRKSNDREVNVEDLISIKKNSLTINVFVTVVWNDQRLKAVINTVYSALENQEPSRILDHVDIRNFEFEVPDRLSFGGGKTEWPMPHLSVMTHTDKG